MIEKQEVAREAVLSAGSIIKEAFGRFVGGEIEKKMNDFVTDIDIQSERMITEILHESYPEVVIMAEEGASEIDGDEFWIVDPLDGTTNFVHGYPVIGVSVAYWKDGEVLLGTIYDPLRGELFEAVKGKGAYLNGTKITVSGAKNLSDALIGTGFPFRVHEYLDPYIEVFKTIFLKSRGVRRAGAAVLDLAYVSAGRLDGFFELYLKPWDMAAGALLVSEAGGVVTNFFGQNNYLSAGNIVAGNPYIHSELMAETKRIFSSIDLSELSTPFPAG